MKKKQKYQEMQMRAFLTAATGQVQRLQPQTGKCSLIAWRHLLW